jgi:O-antigen/teichoic acid export membrane protein
LALNRDLMLVGAGRLVSALLALATIRAATTLLGPERYGELALLVAVQMFCGLFLINPVGQHINLHSHAWWDEGSLAARLKSYRRYVLAVALAGGGIALLTSLHQTPVQLAWTTAVVLFMVAVATWNATLIPMLNMLGFRAQSVFWSVFTAVVGVITSVALAVWWPSATAWLAGQALGMLVGALGARSVLRRHAQYSRMPNVDLPLLDRQTVLTYCVPLSIATGLMWLQLSGYRFVIDAYWGLAQLGFMAVGLQVANQVFGLAESIASQFFYPMFYRQISGQPDAGAMSRAYSDLLNTLAPLYFVLAGLVVMGAPYLLKILVASQFQDAVTFVMLGAGIELCRTLGNLFGNAAQVTRKTHSLAAPYAAGAATTLALVFLAGVLDMPILMGGVALTVGAGAMFAVMWWRMGRQIALTLDLNRWLQGALAMFAMSALAIWLPGEADIWASIAILMVGTMFAGLVGAALLWKNPAVRRLLNVQLGKG